MLLCMILEVVMEVTDNCVGSFSSVLALVDLIIDLYRDCFTANPKHATFPWGQEVYWARL